VGLRCLREGSGKRLLNQVLGVEGVAGQVTTVGVQVAAERLQAIQKLSARLPRRLDRR
jgi:hypothetical protein